MDNSHVNFFHFRDGEYPQTEELEESFSKGNTEVPGTTSFKPLLPS